MNVIINPIMNNIIINPTKNDWSLDRNQDILFKQGLLNFSIVDILRQIIPCHGGGGMHCSVFTSIPGLHLPVASHHLLVTIKNVSRNCQKFSGR